MYAVCAHGPHGFHALGKFVSLYSYHRVFLTFHSSRIIESTLRTMNNLLERLHASFFFYILTDAVHFNKIGSYLPSAILISVAMMFHGLDTWVAAGWIAEENEFTSEEKSSASNIPKWTSRQRPVLPVLSIMAGTHLLGMVLFLLLSSSYALANYQV